MAFWKATGSAHQSPMSPRPSIPGARLTKTTHNQM